MNVNKTSQFIKHNTQKFLSNTITVYMNTGNLIVHPMATTRSFTDENSYVSVKFQKNTGQIGGKLKPEDTKSTRLKELSLINSTHFGAFHYDTHLDMKLDYTISRIFQ